MAPLTAVDLAARLNAARPRVRIAQLPKGYFGQTSWSGRTITLDAWQIRAHAPQSLFFYLAHEMMHVAHRARFASDAAWHDAWTAADARGDWHNPFEHEANRFAFESEHR